MYILVTTYMLYIQGINNKKLSKILIPAEARFCPELELIVFHIGQVFHLLPAGRPHPQHGIPANMCLVRDLGTRALFRPIALSCRERVAKTV